MSRTNEQDQLDLEHESAIESAAKYHRQVAKLEEIGLQTKTAPIRHLMKSYVRPVSDGLLEYISKARVGPGRLATVSLSMS